MSRPTESKLLYCIHKGIFKLTLNTLRKRLDPGIHFNKFNVGENFVHLLDTVICGSDTLSPEIRSKPRHEHLEGKQHLVKQAPARTAAPLGLLTAV